MTVTQLAPAPLGPCHFCGRDAYKADDQGPFHPCCAAWAAEHPGQDCEPCRISEAYWAKPSNGTAAKAAMQRRFTVQEGKPRTGRAGRL